MWETWNNSKELQKITPSMFGKWHYVFTWNKHSASLVQCEDSFSNGLVWEIWCEPDDEEPIRLRSRNACLDYMYRKWLKINGQK